MQPSILLLSLATLGSAVVIPRDSEIKGYVCETTKGSPKTKDVTEMINNLKANPAARFCVVGAGGNDCSPTWRKWSNGNSAAFQACGANGGGMFRCSNAVTLMPCLGTGCGGISGGIAAAALTKLQQKCQKDGRVGGFIDYKSGDLKIIHS
ncbi:hypothetical protein F5B20DRAFT_548850 [Whalleya microplaca]|nr:hypothetical protein F5B20DRAFT_548850 [Whalleya microplaca]